MHRRHRETLVQRQQQLLLRSAELRVALTRQAQALKSPLSVVDQLRSAVQWLGRHPAWPMAALGLLSLARPRRLLRWLPPLMGGVQLLLLLRRGLGRHTLRKP